MTFRSGLHCLAAPALVAVLLPAHAEGQTLKRSFQDLQKVLKTGDSIFVTDVTGHRVRAEIEGLTPSTLTLIDGGRRRALGESDVMLIEGGHHLRKKVFIGLGLGAVLGVGTGLYLASNCQNECELMPAWVSGLAALGAGAGAVVGWGVGVAVGPPAIYRRAPQNASTPSPFSSGQVQAVLVTVKF